MADDNGIGIDQQIPIQDITKPLNEFREIKLYRNGHPIDHSTIFGVRAEHFQAVIRLPNDNDNEYYMGTFSQDTNDNEGGLVFVGEVPIGASEGSIIWSDELNNHHDSKGFNHPGDLARLGSVVLIAGQNWNPWWGLDLGNGGQAVLFYDTNEPRQPKYLGKLNQCGAKLFNRDIDAIAIGKIGEFYYLSANSIHCRSRSLHPDSKWEYIGEGKKYEASPVVALDNQGNTHYGKAEVQSNEAPFSWLPSEGDRFDYLIQPQPAYRSKSIVDFSLGGNNDARSLSIIGSNHNGTYCLNAADVNETSSNFVRVHSACQVDRYVRFASWDANPPFRSYAGGILDGTHVIQLESGQRIVSHDRGMEAVSSGSVLDHKHVVLLNRDQKVVSHDCEAGPFRCYKGGYVDHRFVKIVKMDSVRIPSGWCAKPGSQLLTGDFDGDQVLDHVCRNSNSWSSLNSLGVNASGHSNWCTSEGDDLLIEELNNDSSYDFLCVDSQGEKGKIFGIKGSGINLGGLHYSGIPSSGSIYKIVASHSGMALEVGDNSLIDGGNVQQGKDSNTDFQRWYIERTNTGHYKVVNVGSGKALDVSGGLLHQGNNLQQWRDKGSQSQRWNIIEIENGDYKFLSLRSNLVMDVQGASLQPGANVHQWRDNTWRTTSPQRWKLILLR